MFVAGDDGSLELLTRGPAPRHHALIYGQAPYLSTNPATSGRASSGLNPYAGPYYRSARMSRGLPIWKTILQPKAGASSSSSSRETLDRDYAEDYPKISSSACWNPAIEALHINMVGPARVDSQNSSSKYPTIGESEASYARTPSNNIVRNLNPDFNTVRLQTIMESIRWMVSPDSPLVALA
jgi:hypothetical protein